ncbi:hypothetical protein [Acidisoma silvae]|uniref:Uncharacterized protein n=1 Tax=Acidisoma silvae TaxID=2802396 RepID=A0A964E0K5_9PROT|nr:hypothetical protein [Acidisoma silvae]MCB8877441.1 hypothetical protein [Acidisoma silvae]
MAASGLEGSLATSNKMLSGRLAGVLFILSVAYISVAMSRAPEISAIARGMLFPMKLFLVASAPTVGGIAFLWSDRAISDVRRRRLMRILLVLLWAFASVTLVSLLS